MIRFLALIFLLLGPTTADACGGFLSPCETANGSYHFARPEGAVKGVMMHLHGGGGRGRRILRSAVTDTALARGYAVIAPQGWQPENRWKRDWSVPSRGMTFTRPDIPFLREVLADVEARHGLRPEPLLLGGHSRGGSMVWTVACEAPDLADAYAPVAGAFWDPLPESCAGPVDLFHTHGWTDRVVPLEGRSFRDGAVVQGDVWASLFVLRATNGCANRQPEKGSAEGSIWLRHWSDCRAGRIDLMLHPGGHGPPEGWTDRMLDWFEERLEEKS